MTGKLFAIGLVLLAGLSCLSPQAAERGADSVFIDESLVVGARAVIRGTVISNTCRADQAQQRVFTYTKVRVERVFKGALSEREVVLKEEGGEAGDLGERVFGTPTFSPGEQVFVYLDAWNDGALRVYQMFLGKLSIVRDTASGRELAVRDASEAEGLVLTRDGQRSLDAGSSQDAEQYEAELSRAVESTEARSSLFADRHYRDVPMVAVPSEYAQLDGGEWSPQGSLLPLPARWFEPDTNDPVTFFVGPSGAPNPQSIEDALSAIDVWTTVPATSMKLVNGGPREACSGLQGFGVIVFNNCDGRFQPEEGCSRIIARGGMVWNTKITKEINGQTFRKAIRGFVSLNPFSACSYENHCNLREIITHELGHALGLGHSQYGDATLFGTIHEDGRCSSIRGDDARALAFIYPEVDGGSKPLAITTEAISGGIVEANYVRVVEAEGGVRPYTWAWQPGFGRMPDGVRVDPLGVLVGPAFDTGPFTFRLIVADAVGATAEREFTVNIFPKSTEFDSRFVDQSIPAVQAGQQFSAVLKWANTGTHAWDPGAGGFRAVYLPTPNNEVWGVTSVVPTTVTQPGELLEVVVTATAPAKDGAYDFQWQLFQDGVGLIGQPAKLTSVFVNASLPPVIDAPPALNAAVGVPVSFQFNVILGAAPFVWSVSGGVLPEGLSLNPATGVLSGAPTVLGSRTVTIRVTDARLRVAEKQIVISVSTTALAITTGALPNGAVGSSYNAQLSVSGGRAPFSWSVIGGRLPNGVNLNSASGAISGNPVEAGDFSFTVRVTDADSLSASKLLQLAVSPAGNAPVITSVKWKPAKRKLVVEASGLDPQATLTVDQATVSARFTGSSLVAKKLSLAPGGHQIRVVNPGGNASAPFTLTVD